MTCIAPDPYRHDCCSSHLCTNLSVAFQQLVLALPAPVCIYKVAGSRVVVAGACPRQPFRFTVHGIDGANS